MEKQMIEELLQRQRRYFKSGATLPVCAREAALRKLYAAVKEYECELSLALLLDLGKNRNESYMCELGMLLNEIRHMLRHIRSYARQKPVQTPLAQFAACSYTKATPYGTVLIMSPWNYPVLLTLGPLVDAIAAGNTAVIKPSAYSVYTGQVIEKLVSQCFAPEHVAVILGGREENSRLLETKFDYIFFTGSTNTAKDILKAAAGYLTPVSLELGGKSPCVVTDSAKLELAARRIVFGKFLNCGQTCVAPDFIICDRKIKDKLVSCLKREITRQYGLAPNSDASYGKIINRKHFERLRALLKDGDVVCGGEIDEAALKIAPTVIENAPWDCELMTQEIFGPILPIMCYGSIEEVREMMEERPKPLALYVFSENKSEAKCLMDNCRFGGGCINDTIIHLATTHMGFGGVGESGMGSYHGKAGFDTFSHTKSIVDKKTWLDLGIRYRPYTPAAERLLRMFLR